jgi:hypothetical protein
MERLKATLRDFMKSAAWLEKAPDWPEKLVKIGGLLIVLLGPAAVAAWTADLKAAVPYLLVAVGAYLTWHLAIAWHKNAGPVIWIGEPEWDAEHFCWDVAIENRGPGIVTTRAWIQRLRGENEMRIPSMDNPLETHFRGFCKAEEVKLHEGLEPRAVVVGVEAKNYIIFPFIWPPAQRPASGPVPKHVAVLIPNQMTPLVEQKELRFTLRVDFYDESGKYLQNKRRRYLLTPNPDPNYSLTPNPDPKMYYELRAIG